MVTSNANLITMKTRAKICEKISRTQSKITQEEDRILRLNKSVPVLNKLLVHLINRMERPPRITDDIKVRKVGIGYEPFTHFLPQLIPICLASCLYPTKAGDYL